MPLQNRVKPDGSIVAAPERGTLMGNRGGRFHRPDKTLGKRRWASHHWIACEIHYKNTHHEPMGQGYTSLFFLDEVTALAAGHRPCFFCRRKAAKSFLGERRVTSFDQELHGERLHQHFADLPNLPDGAMIEHGGDFYGVRGPRLLRWTLAGYDLAISKASLKEIRLLTPPLIVTILAGGYQPRWHLSATSGDWA